VVAAEGARARLPFGVPEEARVLDSLPTVRRERRGWSRRGDRLGLLLLLIALVWCVAASRWVAADAVVPWDSKNQFYAFFRFFAAAIHAGHTPFWNPYHYGGHPSIADPQSLIFAPAFAVWAWFDPAPSLRAFDLVVFAHLLVGGLSIGLLGWRAGWPVPASLLAAVVFMLGGPASGRLNHSGVIVTYALFPAALLLMQLALDRRSRLAAAGFGAVAATLALGRNHQALLMCYALAIALAAHIVASDHRRRFLRERAWVLVTMLAVGAAIVAVPLLLTLQFAELSNRPHASLRVAYEASLYPANLASLAVAHVMGTLKETADYWGPNYETLPAVAATDQSFNYLFVSTAASIVLLWFGVAGGWLWRRGNRLLAAMLVVATLYALGRYTPVYMLAFHLLPGIDLFRRPIDAAFLMVVALALLMGPLLTSYVREGCPRVPRWRVAAVAAAGLAVLAWAIAFSARTSHGWTSALEVLKVAPIAALAVAVLVLARGARARLRAAACVAGIAIAELLWFNAASPLNAEHAAYYAVLQKPTGSDASALAVLERELERRHREGERPRVEIVGVNGPWQNLSVTRGLEAINGYNPLRIGAYDSLVAPGETSFAIDQRFFPRSFDSYDCALARELGLEYVVLGRPIEELPNLVRRPVADVLLAGPEVWIYRLHGAQPRVRLLSRAPRIDPMPSAPTAQSRLYPAVDRTAAGTGSLLLGVHYPMLARQRRGRARIRSWRPDRVDIDVESDEPGTLVLHDLHYPGWVAEVDGRPARIRRAERLFRSVRVAAGRHVVVFRFAPLSPANLRQALLGLWAR
jgi:hypothetical protein